MFEKPGSKEANKCRRFLKALFFLVQYDCRYGAGVGGGGEYEIQLGFGWTNGALLHIVQSLPHLWVEEETEAAR